MTIDSLKEDHPRLLRVDSAFKTHLSLQVTVETKTTLETLPVLFPLKAFVRAFRPAQGARRVAGRERVDSLPALESALDWFQYPTQLFVNACKRLL